MASRISVDPQTGMLMLDGQVLSRNDPRLYGSRGRQNAAVAEQPRGEGVVDPAIAASQYWDDMQTRHAGLRQLDSAGVSSGQEGQGFGEFNQNYLDDLIYSDEYGFLARPEHVDSSRDPDDRRRMRRQFAVAMAAMGGANAMGLGQGAAGAAPAAGYMGDPYSLDPGFFDAAGNAVGGVETGLSTGVNSGLDAFEAGLDGGIQPDGLSNVNTPWNGGLGEGGLDPETLAGQGGMGSSRTEQLLNWVRANPLQAARAGISVASIMSGQSGSGSGSGGQVIDPNSPLRRGSTGNNPPTGATTTNVNAPVNTGPGSSYAPVNTAGFSTAIANPGGVTNYAGQTQGGAKVAIDPSIQTMLDFSNERLRRYRDEFIPLEDLILGEATQAGGRAMQEERAGLAADDVANQFRSARGTRQRNLQRGGGGGAFSGRGQALMADLDVGEAGSTALAMNEARRAERDSGFGKRLAAAGMGDKAVSQGLSSLSGGVQAMLDQDRTAAGREASANSLSGTLAGISSREREGAADRDARRYEYDNTFGEGRRRYDLDRGDTNTRFDLTRGDRRYEYDSRLGFDRDRAGSDDEYRRANLNLTGGRYEDENRRGTYRDIGSLLYGGSQFLDSPAGRSLAGIFGFAEGGRPEDVLEEDFSEQGGAVAGPGDETSDSIPAYLSDGEFVLPTEAVKILDQLDPGLLERIQKLGLAVRKMGEQVQQGETLEGEYQVEA